LEIESPNQGHLDAYLEQFVEPKIPLDLWLKTVSGMPGLNRLYAPTDDVAGYSDPMIAKEYQDFESRRGYRFEN
jgi:cell filamentation protein